MHKVSLSILIVLQSCTSIQNLEQATSANQPKDSEMTTTIPLGTTTTLQVECVQESNKDRDLRTTENLQCRS